MLLSEECGAGVRLPGRAERAGRVRRVVPPAAQVRGAVGERVDLCWDPHIPGRLFCSWNHHREVETRGTEEEQQCLLADNATASWTHRLV